MQVTGIRKKTYFGREKLIRAIHSDLFHGCGSRSDLEYPMEPSASATNSIRDRLCIVRPGNIVPSITRPAGNLVCSKQVVDVLSRFASVAFLPVDVIKIVDFWMNKGDMSYYASEKTARVDGIDHIKGLPDSRKKFSDFPQLWELLLPELLVVAKEFEDLHPYDFYFGEPKYGDSEQCVISSALMNRYPLVEYLNIVLIRTDVFKCIASYFDKDFFCFCNREVE